MTTKPLSNHEIVTLAVYLLGGESKAADTEDVAIKANEIAPNRFVWRKYSDQVNLEIIRVYLSDAKKANKGGYLMGSGTDGWLLSRHGLAFAKQHVARLGSGDLAREPLTPKEKAWRRHELARILSSAAYLDYQSKGNESVSFADAEGLFRIDSYVIGKARERKIARIVNTFGDDPDVGPTVLALAKKLQEAPNG